MADDPNNAADKAQLIPGQPGYVSPVYDLHSQPPATPAPVTPPPAAPVPLPAPAAVPPVTPSAPAEPVVPDAGATRHDATVPGAGERVQVGEEVIEIAPHPTTNRYPWPAVDNPTVPIYGTVQQPPAEPAPPAAVPVAALQPIELPQPAAPAAPPAPVAPVIEPPAPEPAPTPEPEPITTPVPEPAPTVEPAPTSEPLPMEPVAAPEPDTTPLPVAPPAAAAEPQKHVERIYSQSTRQAWHVFRVSKRFKILAAILLLIVIAIVIFLLTLNIGPISSSHLPFMEQLLQRK